MIVIFYIKEDQNTYIHLLLFFYKMKLMKFSTYTIASALLATASATIIQFNVVSPNSTNVKVNINGKSTSLDAVIPHVPFFSGFVEVGSATTYNYVADNVTEKFSRNLPSGNSTYNDFFGRSITYANITALPRPLDNGKEWTRADKDHPIFDINYIPSLFVYGKQEEMDHLIKKVPKHQVTTEVTFIGKDFIRTFTNVTFGVAGAGKKNNPSKQQWKLELSPGIRFNNRRHFKLRNMEEDPTQMREKLYADCLRAMGTYANQAIMVRFFINGQGMGTFNMLDDIKKYSYIEAVFYGGNPPAQMGPLYDGSTGASFAFNPDPYDYGDYQPNKYSPEPSTAVYNLTKAFNETDITNDNSINKFGEMFDIDQFLRFMVMEYLGGSWDNYWVGQTNDGAYKDYAYNNTWYYLGQDYDGTFGVNMPDDLLNYTYKIYPSKYPGAVLINGFLQNKNLASTFESYVTDTVKILFNNDTLGRHIKTYRDLIAEDLKWDRSIVQRSPGKLYGWTYEQTYDNLYEEVIAPGNGGGGAQYGLVEWITKKSEVVAKDLGFSL
ncbi:coth protein-domain-containing protein [Cokeromyces recurvatus]|uniref:coth protein-domain-containing protein n=1 Tax=Cokeromyces recurvatus TaxID=90255 RepID=UPI00221FC6AD|nr:coth protein-domain-containing protein [Cokeromyces recurvatus]KAI7905961.1 coth protein-domain-containing protein [Cokeromyces recurvatus]